MLGGSLPSDCIRFRAQKERHAQRTGHTDADDASDNIDLVVRKPFQIDDLDRSIREFLAD
jgi:hypothetical protein